MDGTTSVRGLVVETRARVLSDAGSGEELDWVIYAVNDLQNLSQRLLIVVSRKFVISLKKWPFIM